MGDNKVKRICVNGMLVAVYIAIGIFKLDLGFAKITFASLPVILASLMYGPLDAVIVALLGEFVAQISFSGYGLMPTTPLWMLPPAIRGLLVGLVAYLYRRKGEHLEKHYVIYFVTLFSASILVSAFTTLLMYLDALINNYSFAGDFFRAAIRFGSSLLTALIVGVISLPLKSALNFIYSDEQRRKSKEKETDQK